MRRASLDESSPIWQQAPMKVQVMNPAGRWKILCAVLAQLMPCVIHGFLAPTKRYYTIFPPKKSVVKGTFDPKFVKKSRRVWNLYHFGANKNQLEIQECFFFKQILVRGKFTHQHLSKRPPGRLKHLDQAPSKQAWHFWDVKKLIQFGLSPLLGCNRGKWRFRLGSPY